MIDNNRNLRERANQTIKLMPQVKLHAFTLAEVLITLVIIGVVSVLVLPTVINKVQGYANKRAHQVFHRKFETAILMMQGANETTGYQTTEDFVQHLKKYIKIAKVCDNAHLTECFSSEIKTADNLNFEITNGMKMLDFTPDFAENTNVLGVILQDGTNMLLAYHTDCLSQASDVQSVNMSCYSIVYDVNGSRTPNKVSSASDFVFKLDTKESAQDINEIKDVGLINVTNLTPGLKTCITNGNTGKYYPGVGKCVIDNAINSKTQAESVAYCATLGLTLPDKNTLISILNANASSFETGRMVYYDYNPQIVLYRSSTNFNASYNYFCFSVGNGFGTKTDTNTVYNNSVKVVNSYVICVGDI